MKVNEPLLNEFKKAFENWAENYVCITAVDIGMFALSLTMVQGGGVLAQQGNVTAGFITMGIGGLILLGTCFMTAVYHGLQRIKEAINGKQ